MARKKRVRGTTKRKSGKGKRKRSKKAKALRGTTKKKRRRKGKRKSKTPRIDAYLASLEKKGGKKLRGTMKRKGKQKSSGHIPDAILKKRAVRLGKTVGGRKIIAHVKQMY